jgi:TetR/AcrR family transcriptional regulator, regulator of mycofactocin system
MAERQRAPPLGCSGVTDLVTRSLATELRAKRSEMMAAELEAIALRLFEERGFDAVTVDEIASVAHISVRTFYRYFSAKDDVLQVKIDRRCEALRVALAARPVDEAPMRSLRLALEQVMSAEDPVLLKRWIAVIVATPSVVKGVLGGIQLKTQRVMVEFLTARSGLPEDALEPIMLAAATGGVIQAAQTRWFFHGGDLVAMLSEGLELLERGAVVTPPPA